MVSAALLPTVPSALLSAVALARIIVVGVFVEIAVSAIAAVVVVVSSIAGVVVVVSAIARVVVVRVVDRAHVDVVVCAVKEEGPPVPVPPPVAEPDIAKAVVDAAVEADMRAPMAGIKEIPAA